MSYPDEISATAKSTANGTPFVEVLATPMGGLADNTLVQIPDSVALGTSVTVVFVLHGYQGSHGSVNASKMVPTRDALLDRGYIVVSPNAFGDNWANNAFLQALEACLAWVQAQWTIQHTFIHGTSMGGLGGALAYARGTLGDVAALAMVDPAVNLQADYTYRSDYRTSLKTAYGFTDYATEWATVTAGHDSMLRPSSDYAGAWIYIWASPDDVSIPKSLNADQFKANFQSVTTELTVQAVTGGHVQPSHFQPDVLLAFYDRALGGTPAAPPELLALSAELFYSEERHRWFPIQEFSYTINGDWAALVP